MRRSGMRCRYMMRCRLSFLGKDTMLEIVYEGKVSSNGKMFIPVLVKIHPLMQKLLLFFKKYVN
jgi:hypothetical protein